MEKMDRETLSQVLTRRRARISASLADSITGLPVVFTGVREDMKVLFTLTPEHWMRNPGGVMHGGVVCTAMDNAMGYVVGAYFNKLCPTVNMQVDFIRPVSLETPSILCVEALTLGQTLARLRVTMWQTDEAKPCASGVGLYFTK